MPCTRARSSHTRQRTSSYDEPSAARRPRRGRAHSSAPRGRRAPSLQSTLFIAAPQGHSGRNHSVWGTRAATRHRKRHPPSCVVDPPRASFRPAPLPTDLRPRILYRPPPRAGSYNLRSGSCTYLTPRKGLRSPSSFHKFRSEGHRSEGHQSSHQRNSETRRSSDPPAPARKASRSFRTV